MNPLPGVRKGAWWFAVVAMISAAPAGAQFYDEARRSLALDPDLLARSPRLVGMGRLTYVVDDFHLRSDLWEFAGEPAGLLDSDSTSSFELVPSTTSASTLHDEPGGITTRARQDFALRVVNFGYEAWRRASETTAFGVIGDLSRLRSDVPHSLTSEHRTTFSVPHTQLVLGGKLPFFRPDRFRYGLDFEHRYQSRDDEFRTIVSNGAGDFIDKDGLGLEPPDIFTPDRYGVRTFGGGLSVAYRVAPWLNSSVRAGYSSTAIDGRNEGTRYSTELREDRPITTLGGAVAGGVSGIRYVGFLERWSGDSEQRWAATVSAGSGQVPAQGRGEYADREESGMAGRARATWTLGPWTIGGGAGIYHREIDVLAPPVTSTSSFNYFLNYLSGRPGADSLGLPDSVRTNHLEHDARDFGGGIAVRVPWREATVGVEVHSLTEDFEQLIAGAGPERSAWSVRAGAEASATPALRIRGGYIYQLRDDDELTELNEFVTHGATAGFGLRTPGSRWSMDLGYALLWSAADYGDPTRWRSTRQQGLLRIRWDL